MSYWRGERCVQVLEGVSLDVHPGEVVTVWGRHNSGKTTLLKLAAGLAEPTKGSVSFAGRDLKRLSASGLARLLRGPIAWARPAGPNSAELQIRDYVGMALLRRHNRVQARRLATVTLSAWERGSARRRGGAISPTASACWWRSPTRSCAPRNCCWLTSRPRASTTSSART